MWRDNATCQTKEDGDEGKRELAPRRVRATQGGPRSNAVAVQRLLHTSCDGQIDTPPVHPTKSEGQSRRPTLAMNCYFVNMKSVGERPNQYQKNKLCVTQ